MKKLIEQIKAHPIVAAILLITPFITGTLAITNWHLNRMQQDYDRMVKVKDEDISRLSHQLDSLKAKVAKITSPPQGSPAYQPTSLEIEDRLPLEISMDTFFEKRKAMKSNFAELENLNAAALGKVVHWSGPVALVSTVGLEAHVVLQTKDEQSTGVYFAESQKSRALALRPGDVISFEGWIRIARGHMVEVVSETFEAVPPK